MFEATIAAVEDIRNWHLYMATQRREQAKLGIGNKKILDAEAKVHEASAKFLDELEIVT